MNGREGLWVRRYPGRPPPLVALHGFTQTGRMFAELAELLENEVLAPDLPGHGRSSDHPASFEAAVEALLGVLGVGEPIPLLGYSQGGRLALAVALERPDLVSHLALISATPGIEDELERAVRRRADQARAVLLRSEGLPTFLEQWLRSPMFAGLERRGATWRSVDLAARLENTASGLAAALIGMGQGAQPYLGDRLSNLQMPVMVVAGELDQHYVSLARTMQSSLPEATLHVVPNTGHAVIGEQPVAVADLVAQFLAPLH